MIAVDTSALMAIALDEASAVDCIAVLATEDRILISAGTVAEALIVSSHRHVGENVAHMIDDLGFDIVALTPASARLVALAYATWGKGIHAAALNFGDCFSYALAKQNNCGLLYVGNDFSRTDIKSVL